MTVSLIQIPLAVFRALDNYDELGFCPFLKSLHFLCFNVSCLSRDFEQAIIVKRNNGKYFLVRDILLDIFVKYDKVMLSTFFSS